VARGVDRAAAALRGHGIGKGDVVCLQSAVTPEAGMALWAALGLGAVVVPLNLTWPAPVAAEVYASCRPRLVMADAERAASALSGWEGEAVLLDDGPVDASIAGRATRFSDWMGASQREPAPFAPIDPEATAVVLYTSGTTGAPKGVELSHGALVRSAHLIARTYGFGPDDVLLSPGDLHTIAGLRNSFVLPLMTGTRVILPSAEDRASFLGIVELIRRHRVTVAKVVPRLLRRLAQHADRVDPADLASLRLVLSGTAPLHRFTLDGLATVIRAPVQDYLGISETAGAALFGPFEGSGSVATDGGLPIDLMARIVDADGRPLGVGEVGEIRLYGDRLMRGYLGQPELTEAVLRDGWYRTGDLGAWGEDGRLHLRGRAREAIKIMCGEVVYPVEIEQLIAEDASVREVAVVGFRNRDGDDRLAAFVLREGGADEAFLDAVAARIEARLGRTKVPHRTLVLDDFPRGTHGKVLKDVLVATYLSDE
jgi:acyl-CoA synthetase (AMP-forming)/AMP-acid ligase II